MSLDPAFVLPAIFSALAVIYIMYIAASVTREEMTIHDLRVNTHTLRNNYAKKLADLRGDADNIEINVDILPEPGEENMIATEQASKAA